MSILVSAGSTLPHGWHRTQLRRLVDIRNGRDYKAVEVAEGGYPVYGSGGEFRRASDFLHDGESILFGRKGTIDRPLYVDGKFWTVDTMYYAVPFENVCARFLYYFSTTIPFGYYVTSTALPSVTQSDLASHPVDVPPIDEQWSIAEYLDRETQKIDRLIAEQRGLIETLRERRRAVIDNAFSVKMTGARRLRRLLTSSITGPFGTQLRASEYVTGCVPVINPTHIVDSRIRPDWGITVSSEKSVDLQRFRLVPGDVLLGRKGDVDKAAVVSDIEEGYICGSDSMALRPSAEVYGNYLWWYLQSPSAHRQLELWSVGSTVAGLNQRTISHVEIPIMDLGDQLEVSSYLEDQTFRIDELISESEDLIALSQERREALITAAVTGQIDVRTAT